MVDEGPHLDQAVLAGLIMLPFNWLFLVFSHLFKLYGHNDLVYLARSLCILKAVFGINA